MNSALHFVPFVILCLLWRALWLDLLEADGTTKRGDGDRGVSGSTDRTDTSKHVRRRQWLLNHDGRDYGSCLRRLRRRLRSGHWSFAFGFRSLALNFRTFALSFWCSGLYHGRWRRSHIAQILQIELRNNVVLVRNLCIQLK